MSSLTKALKESRANLRVAAQANLEVASSREMELPTLWTGGEGWNTYLEANWDSRQVSSRGGRGDTQGKPYGSAREALTERLCRAAGGGYKGDRSSTGFCEGVGVAHSTGCILRTTQPLEREEAMPSSGF